MPLPPTLKNWLASACYTLGLALAVYLALLKLFALPCVGPGSCHAILYSRYGSVFHVPVGVFGALLWTAVIFSPDKFKRATLLALLAAGTAGFMIIQFFVLRGFCLYCTLHAVTAWCALALHGERPRRWLVLLALMLSGGAFLASRQYTAAHAQADTARAPLLSALPDQPAALAWLGPIWPRSPTLVLSLDCAACLDLLDELTRESYQGRTSGPAVYFKINDANRTLTLRFIAAVLSQRDLPRRDAFLAAATVLLTEKDNALANPAEAAKRFAAIFPSAAGQFSLAEKVATAQTEALTAAGLGNTTPLLVSRDGRTQTFFKPAELFP